MPLQNLMKLCKKHGKKLCKLNHFYLGSSIFQVSHFRAENELAICEVANYLFCGVKVVGGSNKCLVHLESNAKRFNFQPLKRLAVSGAFHTSLMIPAMDTVWPVLKDIKLHPGSCNIYSNYTGKIHLRKGSTIKRDLKEQIASPVKWEQIQQLLFRKHQVCLFSV